MKDGTNMSSHLNDFNYIFGQLNGQGIDFNDSLLALLLLSMLLKSLDTFKMTIRNLPNVDGFCL